MATSRASRWSALLAAALVLLGCDDVIQRRDQPAETVEKLASLPHGLHRLGPDERALLEAVLAEPAPYVAALREAYTPDRIRRLGPDLSSEEVLRFERAAQLLGRIATPEARELLGDWYDTLARAATEREAAVTPLYLKRSLLDALPDTASPEFVERVAGELVQADEATFHAIAQYLFRAGRDSSAVRELVRTAADDPKVAEGRRLQLSRLQERLYPDAAESEP